MLRCYFVWVFDDYCYQLYPVSYARAPPATQPS